MRIRSDPYPPTAPHAKLISTHSRAVILRRSRRFAVALLNLPIGGDTGTKPRLGTVRLPSFMLSAILPTLLLPRSYFALVLALFRRMAPSRSRTKGHRYDESPAPEPLPTGLIGGTMWSLSIGLGSMFFFLRTANHWWASLDGHAILTQYATPVIWCFFPAFAALAIPWPVTVWYPRRVGRWEDADNIEDASDSKTGMNSFKIMKWLSIGLVGPIGFFTVLALPIHLSISDSEVRIGHYASFHSEVFPLKQATRLTGVDGYRLPDGSFHPQRT